MFSPSSSSSSSSSAPRQSRHLSDAERIPIGGDPFDAGGVGGCAAGGRPEDAFRIDAGEKKKEKKKSGCAAMRRSS